MKRILNVFLSFVIIMSFLIVPTYADGFDTPVDPIDPEEYVEINCSGSNSGVVSLNDTSHSTFTIWVSFSGYYRKQTSTSLPYYYNITATRTGYNTITGVGTPFISSTSYYVSNGKVWCTLTISNNLGTGTVDMSVCDYH